MPATANVPLSGDADTNGLLSGVKWAVFQLTYSFPASGGFYGGFSYSSDREQLNNFEALNSVQQTAARTALGLFASYTALTFSEVTESASVHGDLRLAESDDPSTAWAYFPSSSPVGGDVWVNNSRNRYDAPVKGNYAYHTFIHELGHSLGLEHGHDASDGYAMTAAHDSMEYSVMTYRSYVGQAPNGYTNETWGYAQTPMMYDIAALQVMYGANYATNAGDTTYSWNPGTGEFSINGAGQGAPGGNRVFMTVWDGGGTDTYDFSNYSTGVSADLRPGSWTTLSQTQRAYLGAGNYAEGNVANALLFGGDVRSLIENVTGGSGNDTLIGNDAGNGIQGGAGNDTLLGLGANDVITGGGGGDVIRGGAGYDTARYISLSTSVSVTPAGAGYQVAETGGVDQLQGIERLQFTNGYRLLQPVEIGDYNGDGKTDMVIRNNATGVVDVVLMNGKAFSDFQAHGWGTDWIVVAGQGDFNGDGKSDLVIRNELRNAVGIFVMDGKNYSAFKSYDWGAGWQVMDAEGDFNGDGKSDLVIRNDYSGAVNILLMNGVDWTSSRTYAWGTEWNVVDAQGDYNGDGRSDIVINNSLTGELGILLMNGVNWTDYRSHAFGTAWQAVDGHADFNGDGRSDIVMRNETTGAGDVLLMSDLFWSDHRVYEWGVDRQIADVGGDFNNDGKSDLVLRNSTNGNVEVMLMNGKDSSTVRVYDWGLDRRVIDADTDFNGDGRSDMVVRNHVNGNAEILLMDGVNLMDSLTNAWGGWEVVS